MSDKCQSRVLDTVKFHLQDFYLEFLADKKTIYLSSLAAIKELLTSKTIRDKFHTLLCMHVAYGHGAVSQQFVKNKLIQFYVYTAKSQQKVKTQQLHPPLRQQWGGKTPF